MDFKQSTDEQPSWMLSLLLLTFVGCVVFLATGVAAIHDRTVAEADRRCYEQGLETRRGRVAAALDELEHQPSAESEARLANLEARLSTEGVKPGDLELYAELDAKNDLTNAQMGVYMALDRFCAGKDDDLRRGCNLDVTGRSSREWLGLIPKWTIVTVVAPGPVFLLWALATRRRWRIKPAEPPEPSRASHP